MNGDDDIASLSRYDKMSVQEQLVGGLLVFLGVLLVASPQGTWVSVSKTEGIGGVIAAGAGPSVLTLACLGVVVAVAGVVALQTRQAISLTALGVLSLLVVYVSFVTKAKAEAIAKERYRALGDGVNGRWTIHTNFSENVTCITAVALFIVFAVLVVQRQSRIRREDEAKIPL